MDDALEFLSGQDVKYSSLPENLSEDLHNDETSVGSTSSLPQSEPQDEMGEMLLKLTSRVQELQAEEREWIEFAQRNVMEAARRLSKDKTELQTLRQEKKKKQILEEKMKNLSQMEDQAEKANAAFRRLEFENSKLRKEMEVEKLRAAESAASCKEALRREMKSLKKFQSCEDRKALFQEELVNGRHELSQLQQQLKQAKEYQHQLEAMWTHEEKLKDEALTHANLVRKEREQMEASAKLEEDALRSEAERGLQKYKDDIGRLEHQIAELRLMTDSSKIVALQRGHLISERMDSKELESGEVRCERECVMCKTEAAIVLFLPCAHQVVCAACNELHEKKGMKDCPCCRTPIQRRIFVRFACH